MISLLPHPEVNMVGAFKHTVTVCICTYRWRHVIVESLVCYVAARVAATSGVPV